MKYSSVFTMVKILLTQLVKTQLKNQLTAGGNYDSSTGLYTETTGAGYIWKYMYTIPTDDVLKFLSSDFLPIVLPANTSRTGVVAQLLLQVHVMLF